MIFTLPHFLFALIAGLLSAYLARQAGKDPFKWFGIGSVLGFLGILPIFFLAPQKKKHPFRRSSTPTPPVPLQASFIDGPANKFWYYLDVTQAQCGPMSYSAITTAWKGGKITTSTYVWHEELPEWKPLQELIKTTTVL